MTKTTKRPLGRPRTIHFGKIAGIKHGGTTGYNKGCRCRPCVNAMSSFKARRYYARKIDAAMAALS